MRSTTNGLLAFVSLFGVACSDGAPAETTSCGKYVCVANASCVETVEGMKCQCDPGYTGPGTMQCDKIDDPGNCPAIPAPTAPETPSPTDKADNRSITGLTLSWSEPADEYQKYDQALSNAPSACRDTGREATTRVDIYLGTTTPPPLLSQDVAIERGCLSDGTKVCFTPQQQAGQWLQKSSYEVTTELKFGTTYYWKIVVRNKAGVSAESPIWSFATRPDIRCAATPTVTDQDGNTYDTVQIGSQCWMNYNLRMGTLDPGTQTDDGVLQKSCYKSETEADCPGLYSWNEATNYDKAGTICPTGWRLPTLLDWQLLIGHADFKNFNPQYQGYKNNQNISYGSLGGYYWTATEQSSGPLGIAKTVVFYYPTKNLPPELKTFNKSSNLLSVRCVK